MPETALRATAELLETVADRAERAMHAALDLAIDLDAIAAGAAHPPSDSARASARADALRLAAELKDQITVARDASRALRSAASAWRRPLPD